MVQQVTRLTPLRIVVYDAAERGWPYLGVWWAVGAAVLSGADARIGARSWAEAIARIESAVRREPGRPVDLQIWGHGYQGSPLIAGEELRPHLGALCHALARTWAAEVEGSTVWFRACDVAEGLRGHAFMRDASRALGVPVIAHCAVIAAPYPWEQREICALRPGEEPWWSLSGSELPSCSTLRMSPPRFAFAPEDPP